MAHLARYRLGMFSHVNPVHPLESLDFCAVSDTDHRTFPIPSDGPDPSGGDPSTLKEGPMRLWLPSRTRPRYPHDIRPGHRTPDMPQLSYSGSDEFKGEPYFSVQ